MNRVALFAPDNLTSEELEIVFETLYDLIDESHLSVSFYRTIDIDIVRFFLELPDEYATHLSIHLPGSFEEIQSQALKNGIQYLTSNGTKLYEYNFPTPTLLRKEYEYFVKQIIKNVDEVLSFYKNDPKQISKLLIPFNISKRYKKMGYINDLNKNEIEVVSYA